MATSRFPLVVNTATSRIAELPAGDDLDLSGSDISNVGNITIAGTIFGTLTSLSVSGTISGGNITISTGTANLANLVTIKYNETVVSGGSTGAVTLTPNAAAGTIYKYTLTGNITLSTLSNAVAGTSMTIILNQDATGNRILTSTMKFSGGVNVLTTTANAIDVMSVFYDGTTYYATLSKGYA